MKGGKITVIFVRKVIEATHICLGEKTLKSGEIA